MNKVARDEYNVSCTKVGLHSPPLHSAAERVSDVCRVVYDTSRLDNKSKITE